MTEDDEARGKTSLVLAAALAALAGAVDTYGLARLHDLFVSFMSGNTTALAVALGRGNWERAVTVGRLIVLFVAGAASGEMLGLAARRLRVPVVMAAVAAALAVPLALPEITVAALVLAMGAQNAAMQRAAGTAVSLTFVTGTLVRFGLGLGRFICGRAEGWAWLYQAAPWVGLLIGATAATQVQAALGPAALWPLPAFAAALCIASWMIADRT